MQTLTILKLRAVIPAIIFAGLFPISTLAEGDMGHQSDAYNPPKYEEKDPGKINKDFNKQLDDAFKNKGRFGGDTNLNLDQIKKDAGSMPDDAKIAFIEAMMAKDQMWGHHGDGRRHGGDWAHHNDLAKEQFRSHQIAQFKKIAAYDQSLAGELISVSFPPKMAARYSQAVGIGGGNTGSSGGSATRPGDDFARRVGQEFPGNSDAQRSVGDYFRDTDRPGDAADHYRRAADLNPRDPRAYAGLAQSLAQPEIGDWQGAVEAGQAALAMGNRDPGLIATMRMAQQRMGADGTARGSSAADFGAAQGKPFSDFKAADKKLAERRDYSAAPTERQRAESAMVENALINAKNAERLVNADPRQAIRLADAALKSMPESARAHYAKAKAYMSMKDFQHALESINEAIRYGKRGDRSRLLTDKSKILNRMGRFREAIKTAKDAIAANASNAHAYAQASWAFAGERAPTESLEMMRRAANLDPNYQRHLAAMNALPEDGDLLALFTGEPSSKEEAGSAAPADHSIFKNKKTFWWLALAAAIVFLGVGLIGAVSDSFKDTIRRQISASAAPAVQTSGAFEGMSGAEAGQRVRDEFLGGTHRIEGQIGAGGMGVVYKGHDTALDRPVAIKKMREEIRSDPRERERFLKEARTVAALRTPNIVEIYQILEQGQDVFLVFEFVSGKTISQLIHESKRMSLRDSLSIIRGVAAALDFAHAKGVIHRDLKPSNVMISDEGDIKVMDFGVARQAKESVSRMSMTNTVVGARPYMAPEQEQGMVRKESDVFALAVCLYEMVTGELPYRGVGAGMLMAKMNQTYAPASKIVPGLPAEFDSVMAKGLEPDPDKRWKKAGEFVRAIEMMVPVA